jgi:hypothetical protein
MPYINILFFVSHNKTKKESKENINSPNKLIFLKFLNKTYLE